VLDKGSPSDRGLGEGLTSLHRKKKKSCYVMLHRVSDGGFL
jgi:hypothetical protein